MSLALSALAPGVALASDAPGVMEESWGVEIEMLEPDLDFLLDSLEAGSCYCACEDWCAGDCQGGAPCEAWCTCLAPQPLTVSEDSGLEEPALEEPALEEPALAGLPDVLPDVLSDVAPTADPDTSEPSQPSAFQDGMDRVFYGDVFYGEVTIPTCRCVWRLDSGQACSASVDWPADGDDCDCSRFETPPGCDGDARVISVLLTVPAQRRRR